MSRRSGFKTSREPLESYRGYRIIKVIDTEYFKSMYGNYYTEYVKNKEVHYTFCKEGEEKRPSQDYDAWLKNKNECFDAIDSFIEDDSLYFTGEERQKYIYGPNHKNSWGFNRESLTKLFNAWKKADKRMRRLYEDRLEDANYHTFNGYLASNDIEGAQRYIEEEFPYQEKFELYTNSAKKRIKEPEKLIEGLNKAISDYLISQGIKDTSVKVRYIENW